MKNNLEILTPENVLIEYELAGLGSRFISALIDHILQGIIIGLMYIPMIFFTDYMNSIIILDIFSLYNAVLIIGVLVVVFGYFIFFDTILIGKTPGKMVLGLKVIKENGNPIGILDSVFRNIIRAVHLIPIIYIVDGIFVLFSSKNKRIGDYLSSTVVVKVEKRDIKTKFLLLQNIEEKDEDNIERSSKIAFRVNNEEYRVLKDYINRYNEFDGNTKKVGIELKKYFEKKFDVEVRDIDSHKFLKEIYKVGFRY
jgi:uncharacterized RDD family membrane protein YckC